MTYKIGRIDFSITPWHFNDRSSELRIETRDGNTVITTSQVLDVPDLESHFDYVFDRAKEMMKEEIKKRLASEGKVK